MTFDYNVVYRDMPTTIRSFVRANPDASFTIIINARLSYEDRLTRYRHEVQHIKNGDFDYDREDPADAIEANAHSSTPVPILNQILSDAEIQLALARIRKRKKQLDIKWARLQRRAKTKEQLGHDFFAAEETRRLDPD